MGHSIRSKKKRAFRAVKRERYALKERACLEKLLEKSNLKQYVEEFQNAREETIEDVEHPKQQGSSEVEGGLQEMKDLSEEQNKRNWDSKNQQRRRRKKEKELKMKSKKGKKYRFAIGSMTKSSW
ncbi:hypothetical protein ACHWQZ_G012001 [Mnemiopsis leidyi]